MSRWRFLLLAPWLAAMIMMVVIAMTPPPHTGLIVATGLCMLVLLAGLVPLTFRAASNVRASTPGRHGSTLGCSMVFCSAFVGRTIGFEAAG